MKTLAVDKLTKSFQVLEPPKRIAMLLDQEVDITIIPARTALKFVQFSKKHKGEKLENMKEDELDEKMLEEIMDIIGSITVRSNKTVTKDWLFDNLPLTELVKFMTFVFEGMGGGKKDSKGEGTGDPETEAVNNAASEAAAKN